MAAVTEEQLRKEIKEILKDADLTTLSAKRVRQQLEEKLSCDLTARKKEVNKLVLEYVKSDDDSEEGEEENEASEKSSEEDSEPEEKKPTKRPAPARKPPAKTAKNESSGEEESGSDEDSESEEKKPAKRAAPNRKAPAKIWKKQSSGDEESGSDENASGKDSDGGSDDDWKKPKKAAKKATKKAAAGGGKGKGTGFTRAYTLSPELAALMGAESLPRHMVVKKMWAMIKDRNLYDPKNKQFAICDNDLLKVIGVKRFRTFGMLKYLRPHFID